MGSVGTHDAALLPNSSQLIPFASPSPPLAALLTRASEPEVLLTIDWALAHLPNTPSLGAGILFTRDTHPRQG
jgi:hypothetical protein